MVENLDLTSALKRYGKKGVADIELFRQIACKIDENPGSITNYFDARIIKKLITDETSSCLDRVRLTERLSYGDVGVLLACPGPSLAGILIRELANDAQKTVFYDHVQSKKSTTFFALTEPDHGSDIAGIKSSLIKSSSGHYIVNANKWFIGHGVDASVGVLIVKQSKGPLGLCCLLITEDLLAQHSDSASERREMDTLGLKGARLSTLTLNNIHIDENFILGLEKDPVKRGMMAVLKVFNQMRPIVSAFSLGLSQAFIDYIYVNCDRLTPDNKTIIDALDTEVSVVRRMLYTTAHQVDQDKFNMRYSSQVKVMSTRLIEKIMSFVIEIFGQSLLYDHPLLLKWLRDGYGFEFMEGTSHANLLNVYNSFPLAR